jgi:hypothetical protein
VLGATMFWPPKNGPPLGAHVVVAQTRGLGASSVPPEPTPSIAARPLPVFE